MVNYGVGNVGSLGNVLDYLGLSFVLSADPVELARCDHLILPGVGAFAPAMERLDQSELTTFLRVWAASGQPLLGICLGMQLLLSDSEEGGHHTGLDLIGGQVKKIRGAPRDVHMGWNQVVPLGPDKLIPEQGYGYFVHSYHCVLDDPQAIVASTVYGASIAAVIRQGNLLGIQFHPEKSQTYGLDILMRFARGEF